MYTQSTIKPVSTPYTSDITVIIIIIIAEQNTSKQDFSLSNNKTVWSLLKVPIS